MAGIHRHLHGGQASSVTQRRGITAYNFTYSSSANNSNLYNDLVTDGWDGVSPRLFNITINGSVILGATSTSLYGLKIDSSFPAYSTVTVTNAGTIGAHYGAGGAAASAGGTGGTGLLVDVGAPPVTFDNGSGEIYAGGGGGGGGGGRTNCPTSCTGKPKVCGETSSVAGGAGGHGYGSGAANVGGSAGASRTCASHCSLCTGSCACNGVAGTGGTGGAKAAAGSAGGAGSGCTASPAAGAGGAVGNAVYGDSLITWTATGTINGNQAG